MTLTLVLPSVLHINSVYIDQGLVDGGFLALLWLVRGTIVKGSHYWDNLARLDSQ